VPPSRTVGALLAYTERSKLVMVGSYQWAPQSTSCESFRRVEEVNEVVGGCATLLKAAGISSRQRKRKCAPPTMPRSWRTNSDPIRKFVKELKLLLIKLNLKVEFKNMLSGSEID
jgi:hypothetical protein